MGMDQFFSSPAGVAFVVIVSTASVGTVSGIIRMMVDMARLSQQVSDIQVSIEELQNSSDVMRWSEYGRQPRNLGNGQFESRRKR